MTPLQETPYPGILRLGTQYPVTRYPVLVPQKALSGSSRSQGTSTLGTPCPCDGPLGLSKVLRDMIRGTRGPRKTSVCHTERSDRSLVPALLMSIPVIWFQGTVTGLFVTITVIRMGDVV